MITEFLLDALVPAARIAAPFIQSMAEKGLTATAMQTALEAANLSFRRTDFLKVVRAAKEIAAVRPYISSVRDALLLDPSRLPAPLTRTLRAFSFRVALEGLDAMTGEAMTHFVTVSSSRNLSKASVRAAALAMLPEVETAAGADYNLANFTDVSARVTGATFQG
jgi:hypothetical protein